MFDGNANDESGHGNNGVVYNYAKSAKDRYENLRSAYSFDSVSGFIDIPGNEFNFPNEMSVLFWANPKATQNAWTSLINKYNPGVAGWLIAQVSNINNYYNFVYMDLAGQLQSTAGVYLLANAWSHVAFVKSNATIKTYVNGSILDTFLSPQGIIRSSGITSLRFGGGNTFNGTLDDIYLYNTSLSDAQVNALYVTIATLPTSLPTRQPSSRPSRQPTSRPTSQPSRQPTTQPTLFLSDTLKNGLVAFYPFEGNANDKSGNGNNGVVHSAILAPDRFGLSNRAYSFDGSSSYIEIINGVPFNFANHFSISFWINPANSQPSGAHLFTREDEIYFEQNGADTNSYYLAYYDGQGVARSTGVSHLISNSWNHFVFVKGNYVVSYYLNNVLAGTINIPTTSVRAVGSKSLIMGAYNGGGTQPASLLSGFFNGILDDIFIYNRTLTVSEVTALYNFDVPTSQPSRQPSSQPTTQPSVAHKYIPGTIDLATRIQLTTATH